MPRAWAIVAASVSIAGGVEAQSLPLRFVASEGQEVVRLFQVHTVVSERTSDGTTHQREAARLGGVREQVLGEIDGRFVLHLAMDSLVVRSRDGTEAWREATPPGHPWVQLQASERLELTERSGAEAEFPLVQYLVTGFPGMLLPERPVWPGRTWRQALDVPAAVMTLGAAPEGAARLPLALDVVVDSIVARSQDTLAYLRTSGEAAPARVRDGSGRVVEYRGSVTGSLVWSSGWNRFVTAAVRTWVTIDISGPAESTALRVQTTIRQAVRTAP